MSKKLQTLHDVVADTLLARLSGGEAAPADISNAIKFLKDNGIDCNGKDNPKIIDISETLPDNDEIEAIQNGG